MMSYRNSRWRPRRLHTTSGFVCRYTHPKFKVHLRTKFRGHISSLRRRNYYFRFGKTKFFFRLLLRPYHSNSACYSASVYQILSKVGHQRRHNYTISRWRPRRLHTTSSFVFDIPKVNIYQQTTFYRRILIHGWDITTSGLVKQPSAVLEFYFRFSISTISPQ